MLEIIKFQIEKSCNIMDILLDLLGLYSYQLLYRVYGFVRLLYAGPAQSLSKLGNCLRPPTNKKNPL